MLWAHRQYLRLGARPLEVGFGYDWRLLPSCPETGTSVSGTISATAPSPKAYPRSLPAGSSLLHSRKSPHQFRLALPQGRREGRAHRVRHNHVSGHCQLLTGARSPVFLLSAGQTISGLTTSLTLIPVRDVPTVFAPATFWLSVRSQPKRSSDGGKKEKELSGRAGRIQRVRGYLSRSSDSERIWPRREGLHVHASVSSASCCLRSWPGRRSLADQLRL